MIANCCFGCRWYDPYYNSCCGMHLINCRAFLTQSPLKTTCKNFAPIKYSIMNRNITVNDEYIACWAKNYCNTGIYPTHCWTQKAKDEFSEEIKQICDSLKGKNDDHT